MSQKILSLSEIIAKKVRGYRIMIPLMAAIIVAYLYSDLYIGTVIEKNLVLAHSLSSHVSALLETNDIPELTRFIGTVSKPSDSGIVIVHDGVKIAGAGYSGQLKTGMNLSEGYLSSRAVIHRLGGPEFINSYIYLFSPIQGLIKATVIVAVVSLIFILLIFHLYTRLIFSFVDKGLSHFPKVVKNLNAESSISSDEYSKEIDEFITTLSDSYKNIGAKAQKESLEKAHKLTVDAYKGLIHDLHTPIAALKQGAKIIKSEHIDEATKNETAVKLAEITDQVLSQIKSSKENIAISIDPQISSLKKTITDATEQAMTVRNKRIDLDYDFMMETDETLHDKDMLMRAISNLVINAIDACKNKVSLTLRQFMDEISIQVSDDGDGLELDQVSLYLQGRGKSTKENGHGIGLASANHIVKLHGGRIIYNESILGGASFDIRLQRAQ